MNEEIISPWWISLFLFSFFAGGFLVLGFFQGAWKYVRFGMGFGLGFALIPLWIAPLMDTASDWDGPVVLFLAPPVVLLPMLANFVLAFWVGRLLYGRKQWDAEGDKAIAEKAKKEPTK